MAGLLEGVLPWLYSTGDTLKRNVRGLISDPAGWAASLGQDFQTANQQRSEAIQGLLYPSVMQTPQDRQAAYGQMTDQAVNLMAPTVYHGSPHSFSAFDASKIGTGEGVQAYGHGLYLADNLEVAKGYAKTPFQEAALLPSDAWEEIGPIMRKHELPAMGNLRDMLDEFGAKLSPQERAVIEKYAPPPSNLYKVNLPDSAVAKMLDWDKPLSQQAPEIQAAVKRARELAGANNEYWQPSTMLGGGHEYGMIGGRKEVGKEKAAEYLRQAGIPGIRYLDQGSRGRVTQTMGGDWVAEAANGQRIGKFATQAEADAAMRSQATSNYVVFPGGEGLLNIMERNGQPVEQARGLLNNPSTQLLMDPGKLERGLKGEAGYAYHATNTENLYEIARTGKLKVNKPSYGTDQPNWPDMSIEKRAYFGGNPENLYQFAPEHGSPTVLRTKLTAEIRKESTGDLYSRKPIAAKDLEFLGSDGKWHPLSSLKR